jgi:hypothetical protein
MHYPPLFLSAFFTLLLSSLLGQTLTCATACPQAGEVFSIRTASPIIGAVGQNRLWNFSSVPHANTPYPVYISYDPAVTVPSHTLHPGSNIVQKSSKGSLFLKTSPSGILAPFASSVQANKDRTVMPFPFSYGSVFHDTITWQYSFGAQTILHYELTTISATGTGTVIAPGGNTYNNCLRIKRVTAGFEVDSATTAPFGITYTITSYEYYQQGIVMPVASYTQRLESGLTDWAPDSYFLHTVVLGQANITDSFLSFEMKPNPVQTQLFVNLPNDAPALLQLVDQSGRDVLHQQSRNGSATMDVSALSPGLYLLSIEQEGTKKYKKVMVVPK